ncbi:MAG: hypothetical protein E7G34_24180 [Klebsiella pneumoniae]|nr:hypothetical protein [Klebsiella pneumoniae]
MNRTDGEPETETDVMATALSAMRKYGMGICDKFEGGSSHLIWQVEGDLSQFRCSLPGSLRLSIVFGCNR